MSRVPTTLGQHLKRPEKINMVFLKRKRRKALGPKIHISAFEINFKKGYIFSLQKSINRHVTTEKAPFQNATYLFPRLTELGKFFQGRNKNIISVGACEIG